MLRTSSETHGIESLDTIAAAEWDSLVQPGDLFCSYAWLRHLDEATTPHRVVTMRVDGRLTGAMPMWDGEQEPGLFWLPDFFAGLAGPWEEPFVWLGARRAVRNGLICVDGPQRSTTLRRLLAESVEYAKVSGRAGAIMPYLPVAAATELARAAPDAVCLLHSAEATVGVPPQGMDDILANANGHNRKRRRRELREFTGTGHTLEWTDITTEVADSIAPLIANTRRKYGTTDDAEWMRRVFAAQRRVGLLDVAQAVLCRRNGRLIAAAVCYRHADSLHGRYFGAAEDAIRDGYPYFVTTCYAPIDYAARNGLRQVFLSTSSLEAKLRRGATAEPLAAVVIPVHGAPKTADVRSHNQRVALDYRSRFAAYSSSMSPRWLDFLS
ncbi:peptidogalycan biosysnthesis protein [Nocardia sp. KC 131]|uniref:peptidogalycan biosysnthesis protein n=1 Tax=Nocardia arseniciresistens TaxID=3392119 RepID=UPI00398ECB1D